MKTKALNVLANLSFLMVKKSESTCEFLIYEEKLPEKAKELIKLKTNE